MKEPIHVIISRLRRLTLAEQIDRLVALAAAEKPHSIRREELLSLLRQKRNRELRRSSKARAA